MGIVTYKRNELAAAEQYLQRALELYELSGTSDRIEVYQMMAYLCQARGDIEAAVSWIQKGQSIQDEFSFYRAQRIGAPPSSSST